MSDFWSPEPDGFEELVDPHEASPWHAVFLGEQRVPGLVELDDGGLSRKLDIKHPKGADGATIQHNGYEPAKLTLSVVLATSEHWAAWKAFAPTIAPKLGKPPSSPLAFDHPATRKTVDKVIVESVTFPKRGKLPGTMDVTIKLVQWLPAPKKAGKVRDKNGAGSTPGTHVDRDQQRAYAAREAEWLKRNPTATRSPSPVELDGPSFSSGNAGPNPR